MTISDGEHRPFGKTGLDTPPIWFRADFMDSTVRVIPDQTKHVICAEWFHRVSPPVVVEIPYGNERHTGVELRRTLRRHDVAPRNVVVNLSMNDSGVSWSAANRDATQAWYDKVCTPLGEAYAPRLVTLAGCEESLNTSASHANRASGSKWTLEAVHSITELKTAGRIAGVGIRCNDWRIAKELCNAAQLDFIVLVGSITIMRHPPELIEFLTSLAERQIPVIGAGVFHGGFLVGGPHFDNRKMNPSDSANQSLFAWRKAFTSLCHGHGVRPAHACIQFALSAPGVAAVSLSTGHSDRVAENVDSVVNRIPATLWASMKEERLLEEDYAHLG